MLGFLKCKVKNQVDTHSFLCIILQTQNVLLHSNDFSGSCFGWIWWSPPPPTNLPFQLPL